MDLTKIASEVPGVLAEGARITRKLASDNIEQAERIESLERELTIHKLAERMQERGLEPALSLSEKIAHLTSVKSPEKLAAIEAAVEMSAGGFKLGSLRIEEENTSTQPTTQKVSGELGSSAHYDRLDTAVRLIG